MGKTKQRHSTRIAEILLAGIVVLLLMLFSIFTKVAQEMVPNQTTIASAPMTKVFISDTPLSWGPKVKDAGERKP